MNKHYTDLTIEPLNVMQAWFNEDELRGFLRGNIIKYIARYRNKNGIEDLEKARDYLNKLIEHEQRIYDNLLDEIL